MKNDSTKCFIFDSEVEPNFLDFENSFIIMPECDISSAYDNMNKSINFDAITNQDTIVSIENILFFSRKNFNNVELRLENIFVYVYTTSSSWHPQFGSHSSTDSTILNNFGLKVIRDNYRPDNTILGYIFPLTQVTENFQLKSITLKSSSGYYSSGSYEFVNKEISLTDFDLNILPNQNSYDIKIADQEFIKKILHVSQSMNYSDGNSSSTQRSKSMKLSNIIYTDSTYLSVKLIREK